MKKRNSFLIILISLGILSLFRGAASAEDFKSLKEKGKFFIEKQWFDDAESDLLKAVNNYPAEAKNDDEIHFYLAILYYNKTDIEKSMQELEKALAIRSQEKYLELKRSILTEVGLVNINTAQGMAAVDIKIHTRERFISPRKKVIYNRWENRFQNEKFNLPLTGIYLPVGQYQMSFLLPGQQKAIEKDVVIEPDSKETKIYLLLIEPPLNLEALGMDNQIKLTWEKAGQGKANGFEIYRKGAGEGEEYTKVGDTRELSFLDKNLGLSKKYFYKVRAYDPRIEKTDFSAEIGATTLSLEPPTEIVALGEDAQVKLFWVAASGAEVAGYRLYRSSSLDREFKFVTEVGATTSYIDYDLERGETYIYKLKAFNAAGAESPFSEKVTTKTMEITCPQKIKITADSGGVELIWKKVTQAASYNVYRGDKKLGQYELLAQVSGRDSQYIDAMSKPEDGLNFWYKITSIDKDGKETRPSNPVSLAQPQPEEPERDEGTGQSAEWSEAGVSSAPPETNKMKIYTAAGQDEEFKEIKAGDLYSLVSGLKARQRVYYKIVTLDDRNNPDASISFNLQIDRINQPPVAVGGGDRRVMVKQTFTLDGSGSTDPENDKLIYKWVQRLDNPDSPSSLLLSLQPKVELSLSLPGEYVFYLEVSDGELSNIQTVIIDVVGD